MSFEAAFLRYQLDALPCVIILSAIGYWSLLQSLHNRPRLAQTVKWAAAILILGQIVLGLFLGLTGEEDALHNHNPDLYHALYRYFDGP
jgi:hypothetical protein